MNSFGELTVTAGPAFTAKWLAPAFLGSPTAILISNCGFQRPLRFWILTVMMLTWPSDLGLAGNDTQLFSQCVYEEWLTPMMHPDLAKIYKEPKDLLSAPLLHQDEINFLNPSIGWPAWLRTAGLAAPVGGARFSQADHALDTAATGAGVVLGRITLAEKDLREGRLVAPFRMALTTGAHFRIVCPQDSENRPQVRAFLNWVLAQARGLDPYKRDRDFVAAADVAP